MNEYTKNSPVPAKHRNWIKKILGYDPKKYGEALLAITEETGYTGYVAHNPDGTMMAYIIDTYNDIELNSRTFLTSELLANVWVFDEIEKHVRGDIEKRIREELKKWSE